MIRFVRLVAGQLLVREQGRQKEPAAGAAVDQHGVLPNPPHKFFIINFKEELFKSYRNSTKFIKTLSDS